MADTVKKSRWMPVVLGLSLALNLAVVAAVGGAAWRHSGEERGGPARVTRGGALYMQALPREARRAIREKTRAGPRAGRDATEMLSALRQQPFDPAAAAQVLDTERDAGLQRRNATTAAWLSEITAMSTQERSAYADRLEAMSKRGKGDWKKRGKTAD